MSIETPETIGQWIEETFPGGDPTSPRKSLRLLEEVIELCHACGASFADINRTIISVGFDAMTKNPDVTWAGSYPEPENVPAEGADAYIVLCGLAKLMGFSLDDATDAKMKINRSRKWKASMDGTGYHIKGD